VTPKLTGRGFEDAVKAVAEEALKLNKGQCVTHPPSLSFIGGGTQLNTRDEDKEERKGELDLRGEPWKKDEKTCRAVPADKT